MKKPIIMVSLAALLLTGVASINSFDAGTDNEEKNANIRTVEYDNQSILYEDDYKEVYYKETSFGYVFTAVKSFDSSIFNDIDLVTASDSDEVDVTYEINYYKSEGRITLDAYELNGSTKTTLLSTLEGLLIVNDKGESDVLFTEGDETILLSELLKQSSIDNVGWWDDLWKSLVILVVEIFIVAIRLIGNLVVYIEGLDGMAKALNMTKDSNGIYHADFDCWQSIFGYNDLYDAIFDLGTAMKSEQFDFYDSDGDGYNNYTLWAWKGDYWQLGYGAELGIYRRTGSSTHWVVDKKLAIDMTLKVEYRKTTSSSWKTIIDWDPSQAEGYSDKQWRITGFDPTYCYNILSNTKFLRATYTVKFNTLGYSTSFNNSLKNSFKKVWVDNKKIWTYNSSKSTFSYTFEG